MQWHTATNTISKKGTEETQPTVRRFAADSLLWICLHEALLLSLNSAVSHWSATIRQGVPTVRKRKTAKHIQIKLVASMST